MQSELNIALHTPQRWERGYCGKEDKFSFPPKMYSGGMRRERKQLWWKTIAEFGIRQSPDQELKWFLNNPP